MFTEFILEGNEENFRVKKETVKVTKKFDLWHINLCRLFNAKATLLEER